MRIAKRSNISSLQFWKAEKVVLRCKKYMTKERTVALFKGTEGAEHYQ